MTMIQPQEYKDLKEYWDYQRKVEYNREQVFKMADSFENRVYHEYGPVNSDEMKQMLWSRVPTSEYETPPAGWVPENEDYRLWNEEWPPKPQLTGPKGRPVVLKAKKKNDDNDI